MTYINRGNPSPVNPNASKWPVEATDMLCELWKSGLSCKQIAAEINRTFKTSYTRNAIIGKGQRLGLGTKAGAIRQKPADPGAKVKAFTPPRSPGRERTKPSIVPAAPKPAPKVAIGIGGNGMAFDRGEDRPPNPQSVPRDKAFDALPGTTPRLWTERTFSQCKWPIGDGMSCCAKVERRGYCTTHANLAFIPAKKTGNQYARSLRRYIY